MRALRAVVEYTGLNLHEALQLPCDVYLLCYKNWLVDRLMQTENGRKYLDDCERLKQTKLDRAGLAQLMRAMG